MTSYVAAGPEFNVNSTYVRTQAQADGALLTDGRSVVTWIDADFNTTAGRFIRAQFYDPDGTATGSEVTLVSANSMINPSVTGLPGGGFVVTWQGFGIRAQVFDAQGIPVAPAFDVSPIGANTFGMPDVAALNGGGFAIVWNDNRSTGSDVSGSAVHLRAFDASGAPLGGDTRVNGTTNGNQADSSITALHDGHYVVTWTDRGAPGGSWVIKGRILDAAGTPLGAEFAVNPSASFVNSVESSVTVLANGNFAVAWNEFTVANGSNHQIQVFDASGAAVGARITVPQILTGIQTGPKLLGLDDGGFAIAWTANAAPQSDGSGKAVFVQIFDDHSQPAGGAMQVNTQANGDQFDPGLTAVAGGGFMVTWTDTNGPSADDDQVKAQLFLPPRPITITSDGGGDTAAVAVDENQTLATHVAATGSASIVYAIDGGDDAALFTIDTATGVLRFVNAPDFEAPADAGADNVYVVRVRASGGAFSDTQTLAVTVNNANEPPVITSHGGGDSAALTVMENAAFVGTVVASDPEGAATYSIVGGADAALFMIDPTTGALSFVTAPDFEVPADTGADNVYDVVVRATDAGGASDTQALAITIGNVNEAPVITSYGGVDSAAPTVAENASFVGTVTASDPEGAVTYSIVGGADAALFTIDPVTGALAFITAPNFEAPADAGADNIYDVVVQASDGAGLIDTQTLAVTVGNVNEAPVITSNGGSDSAALTVTENASFVGTVTASDPEGAVTYSIVGGADAALFTIDPTTGALAFITAPNFEAPADAGADNVYDVIVQASDGAGLIDTQTLAVTVGNVNEAPVITSNGGNDSAALTVAENSSFVGTVTASDPEGAVTYSIVGGVDAALFTIDPTTGALAFITAPNFEAPADAGADNVYDVVVQASDADGASDTQTLAVTIQNIGGATITGTNVADTLTGTREEDVLSGLGGNDTLDGADGNDLLDGGTGKDTMAGGLGNDTYVVDNTGDVVTENAGEGTDTVRSSIAYTLGADVENLTLTGTSNINGTGNAGDNVLTGNAGNNVLAGLAGADALDGGAGTDTASYAASSLGVAVSLAANTGQGGDAEGDTFIRIENLTGSAFDDTLEGDGGNNVLNGGAGNDTVSYAHAAAGVTVSLAITAAQNTIGAGLDTLTSFLHLTGSSFDDVLTGSSSTNVLTGLDGNDWLSGGSGADAMIGGTGDDTYVVDNIGDLVVEDPGEGTDTVLSSVTYVLGPDIENLILTGTANISGYGNETGNTITGNAGNNVLSGLGGADVLDGGAGTDTANYAVSGAGVNVSLATNTAHGGDAEGDSFASIENLTGSGNDDTLEGDAGNNVLNGGAGIDTASYEHATAGVTVSLATTAAQNTAGAGTDALTGIENLTGSQFDDVLTGSTSNNVLSGLDGDDVLTGGNGADTLIGGSGADQFVFAALANSSPATPDTIIDFTHGLDLIDLSAIDANTSASGNQAFAFGGENANALARSLTWYETGGNTLVQVDVNGNTTADLTIVLTGVGLHLTAADFIL